VTSTLAFLSALFLYGYCAVAVLEETEDPRSNEKSKNDTAEGGSKKEKR
jgi:hypothetical protein